MIGQINALLSVAGQSLRYRRGGVALTVLSVAMSVFLLLTVEHVRQEARTGFASTVSGVDLIVGARTGEVNLLLLSIFRIGNATANISADSVEAIADHENIEWVVPISLGDSHRGFRVVGTTADFFNRYKYGRSNSLGFSSGHAFNATEDIVLGHAVAAELGYDLADSIVLSHGVADTSFTHHDEAPFAVSGILAPTGTPVDNALFASLAAIDLIHDDGAQGEHDDKDPGEHKHDEHGHENEHDHHESDKHGHENQHGHQWLITYKSTLSSEAQSLNHLQPIV